MPYKNILYLLFLATLCPAAFAMQPPKNKKRTREEKNDSLYEVPLYQVPSLQVMARNMVKKLYKEEIDTAEEQLQKLKKLLDWYTDHTKTCNEEHKAAFEILQRNTQQAIAKIENCPVQQLLNNTLLKRTINEAATGYIEEISSLATKTNNIEKATTDLGFFSNQCWNLLGAADRFQPTPTNPIPQEPTIGNVLKFNINCLKPETYGLQQLALSEDDLATIGTHTAAVTAKTAQILEDLENNIPPTPEDFKELQAITRFHMPWAANIADRQRKTLEIIAQQSMAKKNILCKRLKDIKN